MSNDCLFCKIINGEVPSHKVYEDEDVIAFLDISPLGRGHTVVIPVKHFDTLWEFPEKEMEKFFGVVKQLAILLKTKLKADGINILQNNFKAAGQVIFHMHYHIIPRWDNDNRNFLKQSLEVEPEYFINLIKEIKG